MYGSGKPPFVNMRPELTTPVKLVSFVGPRSALASAWLIAQTSKSNSHDDWNVVVGEVIELQDAMSGC